jgi:hypothetical protein
LKSWLEWLVEFVVIVLHATFGAFIVLVHSSALETPFATTLARNIVTTRYLCHETLAFGTLFQALFLS